MVWQTSDCMTKQAMACPPTPKPATKRAARYSHTLGARKESAVPARMMRSAE